MDLAITVLIGVIVVVGLLMAWLWKTERLPVATVERLLAVEVALGVILGVLFLWRKRTTRSVNDVEKREPVVVVEVIPEPVLQETTEKVKELEERAKDLDRELLTDPVLTPAKMRGLSNFLEDEV